MSVSLKLLSATALAAALAAALVATTADSPPQSEATTGPPRTMGLPFKLDRLTDNFSGPAAEVLQVSGYTYVRVAVAGGDRWAVGLRKPIAVGDLISVRAFGAAHEFQSTKLQRRFDELWFGVLSNDTASLSATQQEPT